MFSTLHSSLAPPNARRGSSDSLTSINEILDTESHGTSTSQKRQAPLLPGQKASAKHEVSPSLYSDRSQSTEAGKPKAAPRSLSSKTAATSGYLNPIAEVSDSKEKESSAFQSDKRPPLPLPDYEKLFPKKRHGIQGQVKWDKVISEVNLKQKKNRTDIDQNEMSIDGPDLNSGSIQVQDEKPDIFSRMTENQDQEEPFPVWKRTSITNKRPVVPPKPKLVTPPGSMTEKPNRFASRVFLTATPKVQNMDAPQAKSRILLDRETKVQNTDDGKGKDNSPKDMQNSTIVVSKDVVSQGDTKTPFKSSEDSSPVEPRQSSLNKAPIRNASNQETLGSVVIQKPQNEAKDTKVLEKVSGTKEIDEVFMTTNNADLFSGSIFLKTPTVTKPDLEEKAVQSPAKQLVVEPDPFPNNLFLSKDLVVDKSAEFQGDTKTPVKSTKESPIKPRQSSLNKAPIRTIPVQEKLGSMVTQKPQNEAKDTPMLEEVPGTEEVNEVSMTTNNADLFSGSIFLKTPTVTKPDFKERAVENSPVKEQVVELDSSPNDLFLSKDPVLVKDAESQGDTKTPVKSIKESPPVKPRQSSLNKAPIRTIPVQEKLGSMVTQKPQNEAKDTKVLEKVSGTKEIDEVFMTSNNADLFSGSIFLKTSTVTKPDLEEKAVQSPAKQLVVEPDPFPNNLFLSKDLVMDKNAESQDDAKTPVKSTEESPSIKPRQRSLNKAPIRTIPVQEKLGSMVTQKPQNEAKDSKILEKVSGSEEINEESTTMTKGTDLFSDSIFVKTNVSKLGCEEKAEESPAKWPIVEPDPFPNDVFLSKDPWALPLESKNKSEQRMSEEDLEKIFSSNEVDPFTGFVHNESAKFPEPKIEMTGKTNAEQSSGAQSDSFTKKKAPPVPVNAANADKITTEHLFKLKPKVTTLSTGEPKMETHIQNLGSPAKRESAVFQSKKTLVAANPIPSASSPVFSSLISPEPQMSATEEGTAQHGVTSGGKTLLRAWVTPSESQSVSVQNSSGGGAIGKMGEPASSLRRPHPVKPLGSESLISASTVQGRDSKPTETHEPVLRKPKVIASESGPYSQLTQEELITLVVKQQAEISKKDAKILELEEYIDNLLVRVIDEKPSILMSMPTSKKAF
ncbi:uncharacterized protein rab11fip1a isoform X2 [Paramormyrops kingsleyae]|nr:uncharacterized protein LOC111838544 isoform X3 [Paramormyrops kingsleyae]